MKKLFLLAPLAALAMTVTSCKDDDPVTPVQPTQPTSPTDTTVIHTYNYGSTSSARTRNNTAFQSSITGNTLRDTIWKNTILYTGQTYLLSGTVYVTGGATLRIEKGAIIKGEKSTKGTLVITRNGKIDAQGTASQPVIFTSNEGTPNRGDWGGIIILGNARNNSTLNGTAGIAQVEGGVNNARGFGQHGGTDDGDSSGTMTYVRIEYPGIAFQPDNEINGLTMGSVGTGTTIDYVEVFHSGDDAFEWFGGTVNAKHLVAVNTTDDDFDTDFGYTGKVQFGISLRDPAQADFVGTSNGFESDNDGNGTAATPRTAAVFSNMTMVGPRANGTAVAQYGRGQHIRRNSSQSIFNSAFIGWNTGIRIEGSATAANFASGAAEFKNNFVANATRVGDTSGAINPAINVADIFNAGANTAELATTASFLASQALGSSFNATPNGGSVLLSGASFTSSKLSSGFEPTTYRGAIGTTNWTSGWARF